MHPEGDLRRGQQPRTLPRHAARGLAGRKPFATGEFVRHLPLFLADLTDGRSLPAIADEPFRDRFKAITQPHGAKEKAAFYAGCLIDFAYPEMGEALVKILNTAGIEVIFPEAQTCCGAPARYSGAYEVAARNAIDNIKALVDRTCAGSCLGLPDLHRGARHEFISDLREPGQTEWLPQARRAGRQGPSISPSLVKKLVDEGRLTVEGRQGARGGHLPRLLPPEADAPWPRSRRASCWRKPATRSPR